MWTPEELAEMAAADAEIEAEFRMTAGEYSLSASLDRVSNNQNPEREPVRKRPGNRTQHDIYEARKEDMAIYHKAYYAEHRDAVKARQRSYYEANKEHSIEKAKAYYYAHRDEILAKRRARKARLRAEQNGG